MDLTKEKKRIQVSVRQSEGQKGFQIVNKDSGKGWINEGRKGRSLA